MRFEILPRATLADHFDDYSECESLWKEISEADAYSVITTAREVTVQTGEPRDYLILSTAIDLLKEGHAISLPGMMIRERNDHKKCPRCGNSIIGIGALSRIDNETVLCRVCGDKEALEDFFHYRAE